MWTVCHAEAFRLINIFSNTLGAIYPMLDLNRLTSESETIYAAVDSIHGSDTGQMIPGLAETLLTFDTTTLKLVTAVALLVDAKSADPRASRLFESVRSDLTENYWHEPDLQNIIHFILAVRTMVHLATLAEANHVTGSILFPA